MKRLLFYALSLAVIAGCMRMELTESVTPSYGGQKATLTFNVEYPQQDPESKVAFDSLDATKIAWTGEETMTLIFGRWTTDGKDVTTHPILPSVAPGKFSGEITIPEGFTIDDLHGLIVPGDNGAWYDWQKVNSDTGRIEADMVMNVASEQTQALNGVPEFTNLPFFHNVVSDDLITTGENTYELKGGIFMKSAADMIRFKVYGSHPQQEAGEVLKSVKIVAVLHTGTKKNITGKTAWPVHNQGNGVHNTGNDYLKISLAEEVTIADKTADNGIELYAGIVLGGKRYISQIVVETDRAVYSKTFSTPKTMPQMNVDKFTIHRISVDMSKDYTRESLVSYSVDGGQTWVPNIPETFSSLKVQTGEGADISAALLDEIKAAIAKQAAPVDLDLRGSTYESTIFPAVFKATAAERGTLLKSIRFPHNVNEVASSAFAYCSTLESVDLTDIATINTKSFYYSGLKTLDVPKTVTNINGYLAFGCCAQLNEIYYDSPTVHGDKSSEYNHATFAFVDMSSGLRNTDNCETSATDFPELHPTEPKCVVTIGPNVTYIHRRMFSFNDNVAEIIFHGKPSSVGNFAFKNIHNVHTFDCRLMPSPISSATPSSNFTALGKSAKANGKELKILVSAGMADAFKAKYPFKWMVSNGWTIQEENFEPATLENVRLGTYNVRYANGDKNSATNKWAVRKARLVQSVRDIDFDIFGIQEAETSQQTSMREDLGDIYAFEYFCPNSGSLKESVGLAYKKSEWSLATVNKFWISPTPDTKGAYDKGSSGTFSRGAICGTFIHKKAGTKIFFMCTHGCLNKQPNLDYAYLYPEQEARFNPDSLPSFFVGDLNARPEYESSVLFRTYWQDAYMAIDSTKRVGCENTYNGFDSPEGRTNRRIDFIYYKGEGLTLNRYTCDNTLYDGKYPSDHWPLYIDVTIAPATVPEPPTEPVDPETPAVPTEPTEPETPATE